MRDSTHLAKDRTEKLSQYVAILLEHKTVQSQQQKADVWINSGNHSFSKTRRQKKKKLLCTEKILVGFKPKPPRSGHMQ